MEDELKNKINKNSTYFQFAVAGVALCSAVWFFELIVWVLSQIGPEVSPSATRSVLVFPGFVFGSIATACLVYAIPKIRTTFTSEQFVTRAASAISILGMLILLWPVINGIYTFMVTDENGYINSVGVSYQTYTVSDPDDIPADLSKVFSRERVCDILASTGAVREMLPEAKGYAVVTFDMIEPGIAGIDSLEIKEFNVNDDSITGLIEYRYRHAAVGPSKIAEVLVFPVNISEGSVNIQKKENIK